MKVVIAGGGTAGHVNPALALAHELRDDDVSFVGTPTGIEARLVASAGHPFDAIAVEGFDRARPLRLPAVGIRALAAISAARSVLIAKRPDAVIGMGGYVSLPVCVAAATLRVPVVLHEQNIVLGLAHRVCRPFARRIAVSFEETLAQAGPKGILTGNPVVPKIAQLDRDAARRSGLERFGLDPDRRTVLVFGGSLGARTINRAAGELALLWAARTDVQVLHISGRSPATQVPTPSVGPPVYRVLDYTDAIEEAYAVADLAVCRAGAGTIAELTAVGLPAVLIPYPHHRDRQQYRHAEVVAGAGAGTVIEDSETSGAALQAVLDRMLEPAALERAAQAARGLARPHAAHDLATVVRGLA